MTSNHTPDEPESRQPRTPEEEAAFDARIAARAASHSGMPEVTTSQWALVVRAAGDKPVPFAEIIATLMTWFSPILSTTEIEKAMNHCLDMGWIEAVRSQEDMYDLHTTALGQAVIEAVQRPLLLATMFGMANSKGLLGMLSGLPGMLGSTNPTARPNDPAGDDTYPGS